MRPSGRILMETGMVTTHQVSIQTDAHTPRDTQNTIGRDVQTPMRTATRTPVLTGHRTMGLTHSSHDSQWSDSDSDGYGDNPAPAYLPDDCPQSSGSSTEDRRGAQTATETDGRTMATRLRATRRSGVTPTPMAMATTIPADTRLLPIGGWELVNRADGMPRW